MTLCQESNLYEFVTSDKNIFRAIYSLQHHSFERDLLSGSDLELLASLEDSFNGEIISDVICNVKERLQEVLLEDDMFTYKVYFKPKSVSEDGETVEGRPIHTINYCDQIALVSLLNILLFRFDINKTNGSVRSKERVVLSQITASLPQNFYGNLVSLKPEFLFQPWTKNYRKYMDKITEGYRTYYETKEFTQEVSLDLKQFFPSLNPVLLYNDIFTKHSALFKEEGDRCCFKRILFSLLFGKVEVPSELENRYYGDKAPSGGNLVKGIPQGLPHAYFFGNLGMVKVAEALERILKEEENSTVKAYYYVDDSVIFCNINKKDFSTKINEINKTLKKRSSTKDIDKIKLPDSPHRAACLKYYTEDNFKLEVHPEGTKSTIMSLSAEYYGLLYLNNITREASALEFERHTTFSETEDIALKDKLKVLTRSVEEELKRVREFSKPNGGTSIENYIDSLIRLKKFFKYRYKLIEKRLEPKGQLSDLRKDLEIFSDDNNDKIRQKEFYLELVEDIYLAELFHTLRNFPDQNEYEKIKALIEKLDLSAFGTNKGTYLTKAIEGYNPKEILTKQSNLRYQSIENKVRLALASYDKAPPDKKFDKFREIIKEFREEKGDHYDRFFKKEDCFVLVDSSTDELKRRVLNAYASKMFSFSLDDQIPSYPLDQRAPTLKEYRLLLYLRNKNFKAKDFYDFAEKVLSHGQDTKLDLSVLEVVSIFKTHIGDPALVDNLLVIHDYASAVWKNGSKHLHFYTLHNQEHAIELIKAAVKITKLIRHLQIGKLEYYVLFIACYLHDISMAIHPDLSMVFLADSLDSNHISTKFKEEMEPYIENFTSENNSIFKNILLNNYKKLDAFFEEHARKSHARESAEFIRQTTELDFLEDYIKELVAEVSAAHGYDTTDVYGMTSQGEKALINKKYIQIVLRLADLFDMADARISKPILKHNRKYMSDLTHFHWLSHQAVADYELSSEYRNKLLSKSNSEADSNKSFLGRDNLEENFFMKIYLNNWQAENVSCKECDFKRLNKTTDNLYELKITDEKCQEQDSRQCYFMCRWMTVKHNFLFAELYALQEYLRSCNNYFKTNITVTLEREPNAKPLDGESYKAVMEKIKEKRIPKEKPAKK